MWKRCPNTTGRSARTSSEVLIMQAQKLSGPWKNQQHQICITRLYEEVLFELLNAPAQQNRISDTVSQALQFHQCKIICNGYKQTRIFCFRKLIKRVLWTYQKYLLMSLLRGLYKVDIKKISRWWTTAHKKKKSREKSINATIILHPQCSILNCLKHHF